MSVRRSDSAISGTVFSHIFVVFRDRPGLPICFIKPCVVKLVRLDTEIITEKGNKRESGKGLFDLQKCKSMFGTVGRPKTEIVKPKKKQSRRVVILSDIDDLDDDFVTPPPFKKAKKIETAALSKNDAGGLGCFVTPPARKRRAFNRHRSYATRVRTDSPGVRDPSDDSLAYTRSNRPGVFAAFGL